MADDVAVLSCFADLTLFKCRAEDECSFAAKQKPDFDEHMQTHQSNADRTCEMISTEDLSPGTVLLKCQLCEMLIADKDVDDFWKRHYRSAGVRLPGRNMGCIETCEPILCSMQNKQKMKRAITIATS